MTASGWLGLLVLMLFAGIGGLAWIRMESEPPAISAPEAVVVGDAGRTVALSFSDSGAGLREIRVVLRHSRGEAVLAEEKVVGNLLSGAVQSGVPREIDVTIDPGAQGLPDGDALLIATASDWSWRGGLGGNVTELEIPLSVDRAKPRVQVATGLTYIHRGGSGAVAYTVSEATVRDGVVVGEAFFPGYPDPHSPGRRIALYAVPTDASPKPAIQIAAEDAAGNTGTARWPVVVRERILPDANVTLPASFLENTVRGLADDNGIDTSDLNEAFREINTAVRKKNEEQIREATAKSSQTRLFTGHFGQLANSKVTSRFAEHRSYFVGGQKNSEAIHFGYDLASTSMAPITVANAGRVVYADDLGIYGNCVLVDHGLGLATLYGHLSRIDVSAGDEVTQGAVLGQSGATGLAGGDHLHFAILLAGSYVDPLEWWDPAWVQTHIDARIGPSPSGP